MEIYLFDRTLHMLGMLEAYTSLQWVRRFYKPGEFELVVPIPAADADAAALLTLLQKENIVWPKGKNEAGYIYYIHPEMDDKGQETLDIKGNFLTGYLGRRIVWDNLYLTGTAESMMRTLVDKNAVSPSDSGRVIPMLSLGNTHGIADTGIYQTPNDGRDNLGDALNTLAAAADVGQHILFDLPNKSLKYEVWRGLNRTVGQSENPRAIFCREYENVLTQEYSDSNDDLRNVALVDGKFTYPVTTQKTDSDGKVTTETTDVDEAVAATVGTASGLDRCEAYVSSDSSSKIDTGAQDGDGNTVYTYLSKSDFLNLLTQDGTKELAQHAEVQSFSSTINLYGNLSYQTDWDLGDSVTFFSRRWGLQLDTRITEVKETYEENGMTLDVTFGNDLPTLLDKIKRVVK